MIQGNRRLAEHPVPLIDPTRCDGCGLCVRVCPTGALAVQDGLAVVAAPDACNYTGLCEAACPTGAIQRPFEIVALDDKTTTVRLVINHQAERAKPAEAGCHRAVRLFQKNNHPGVILSGTQ